MWVYGDRIVLYPKPYSINLQGTIGSGEFVLRSGASGFGLSIGLMGNTWSSRIRLLPHASFHVLHPEMKKGLIKEFTKIPLGQVGR